MPYGVSASDSFTCAAVALLVGGTALVATYVPARRALRIDLQKRCGRVEGGGRTMGPTDGLSRSLIASNYRESDPDDS